MDVLPVHRADRVLLGIAREQDQDLGLQRIGVLKLVDEQVRQPLPECPPDLGVVAQQCPCFQQQIDEVERAFCRLERLIAIEARLQIDLQRGGQVGVRMPLEVAERVEQLLTRIPYGGPSLAAAIPRPAALVRLRELSVVMQIDQTSPRAPSRSFDGTSPPRMAAAQVRAGVMST